MFTRSEKGILFETAKRINSESNFLPKEKHMGPALVILHKIHIGSRYQFRNCSDQQFQCIDAMTFFFPWQKVELLHTPLVSQIGTFTVSVFKDCEMLRDKQATKCLTRGGLFMTYMKIKSD